MSALVVAGVGLVLATRGKPGKPPVPTAARAPVVRHDGPPNASALQPATQARVDSAPEKKEWTAKFHASNDYLKFINEALPAAKDGDGRAAWYIGRALQSCLIVMKEYHGSPDPEAQLQQELTSMHAEQWVRDQREQKTRRCLGLAREGAPDGESSAYWYAQALAAGDPLAQEDTAARALADISVDLQMSGETKAAKLKIVQDNLKAVIESGDVEALYRAGNLLANPRTTDDTMRGFALALAACNMGRDCSADNPDNLFYGCKFSGTCPPNADYAYFLQQSLGQDGYAQLYALAQQVEQSVRAGNYQTVLASLKIDRHP
ncbi:MAG TPA: hypothetical protein VMT66_09710 [Steroidobacteraceae bacterium]|nr:hypothetical protein [Steroidobacteraceae bacterium]